MRLSYETLRRPLVEAWVTHKGTATEVVQIVVHVECDGQVGSGTAVFAKELGMTADTVPPALDRCAEILSTAAPHTIERTLDQLEAAIPNQPTAVAAVDMALHDLLGKAAGMPLHRLWGLEGLPLPPTGRSIGRRSVDLLLERARQLRSWPIVKLKVSSTDDLPLVARVREVYDGRLWIDANGCFTPDEAIAAARILADSGVELFEQPVAAGSPERLGHVRAHAPLPIVADEDCVGPADLLRLRGHADAVVLKLLKCGGLRRAREMIHLAHRLDLKVMLGCKAESVIGVTAMAQLGGLADYLDLDGHLGIADDAFTGITVDEGRVGLPTALGIGVTERV